MCLFRYGFLGVPLYAYISPFYLFSPYVPASRSRASLACHISLLASAKHPYAWCTTYLVTGVNAYDKVDLRYNILMTGLAYFVLHSYEGGN